MIDVLLIYPPVIFGKGGKYGLPPMGVLYLAAYLNDHGIKTKVIDAAFQSMTISQVVAKVASYNPKLVGISGMTPHFKSIKMLCDALKESDESIKICLGGPHFNATLGEAFEYINADYIVFGEGEKTLEELYRNINEEDLSHINGLIFTKDQRVIMNAPRPAESDLDKLPFPNLYQLDTVVNYRVRYGLYERVTGIMASRGCPFKCSFCDVYVTQGRKLRLRTPQNIIDEIKFNLENFNIREYIFKDSTFTINRDWVNQIVDRILEEKFHISWTINTRVELIDRYLAKRLKEAGCRKISFGVESGNETILNNINKNITLEKIREAFSVLNDLKIESHAFFMIGNIGETVETVEQTIKLSMELKATWAAFSPTVAYPGTQLYKDALKRGLLDNKFWYLDDATEIFLSNIGSISKGQLNLPELPPEKQLQYVKKAYRAFYMRPQFILNILKYGVTLNLVKNLLSTFSSFIMFMIKGFPKKFLKLLASKLTSTIQS